MARPLYKTASKRTFKLDGMGHAGLYFDKFCDKWEQSWSLSAPGKLAWIETVAGRNDVGDSGRLEEACLRVTKLVESAGGRSGVFVTESRFVTGLGRSHPVENGFAWHQTLGVPYLAGSSVKGMVKAWLAVGSGNGHDKDELARLFGDKDRIGSIDFLDAIPTASVRLEADVMTPHFAGWNEADPPGDWKSPVPIPFLVTAAGTPFLFGIIGRSGATPEDLDLAWKALGEALEWAGAGAKTAVGYGRMIHDADRSNSLRESVEEEARAERERLAEEKRQASMTPLDREIEKACSDKKYKGLRLDQALFKETEAGTWDGEPEKKQKVLARLKSEMEKAGKWRPKSSKKKPEKDRDYQNTLKVMDWLKKTSDQN